MKDDNKVISTCWVIEAEGFGPQPKIYLNKPLFFLHNDESAKEFATVFEARAYINFVFPGIKPEIVRRLEHAS